MEHALRREIAFDKKPAANTAFEMNEHGFPVLRRRKAAAVTSEVVYQMMDEEGL